MDAGEPALGHLPCVEQEVSPVEGLYDFGRAQRGAAGALRRAVAHHVPDLGLAAEPGRLGLGRAIGQQVDGLAVFEIDHDGAVVSKEGHQGDATYHQQTSDETKNGCRMAFKPHPSKMVQDDRGGHARCH